ncbi:MAG: radical SAM protein [Lachnospiraceae bacterium]|nr:radical SAM protein [Lachnospiraceae bacterium]
MRILLIKPETVGVFSYTYLVEHEPLELEYLYTAFRAQGEQPVIYDRRYELCSLKVKLKQVRPEVVCITGYITQQKLMIRLCDEIKEWDPSVRVILGGSNVEINFRNYYDSRADYLYHLSGLKMLSKLLRYIRAEKSGRKLKADALSSIPGICYRKDGEWIVNPKIVESPEELPIPDRTYFYRNIRRFRYLCFRPLALVKNSYSCRKACNFCFCTNRNSGRYACRNVESLVNEIASLDVPAVHITDDDFLIDEAYLREFIRLIREKGVHKKYLIYGRADFIAHHEELIKELAEIGLALVMVGLEATDKASLDSYNKHVTPEENEECIRILHENHIFCAGLFIVEQSMTKADFKRLYRWIAERDIIPTVSVFTPMQGSAIYTKYEDELLTKDVTKQDLFHCLLAPEHMSLRRFMFEYYRLSLGLAWKNRNSSLYEGNNYPGAMLYILWVLLVKLKRRFIL